jgi:hypothetical protein
VTAVTTSGRRAIEDRIIALLTGSRNEHPPPAVERYLLPSEKLIIKPLRQHPAKLLPPLTAAVGGLLAAIAVGSIPLGTRSTIYVVWILAAVLIIQFALETFSWSVQYMALTNIRFLITCGVPSRKVISVPILELEDMVFGSSAPDSILLGYGSFTIELGGRTQTVIDYIPYPEQVYLEALNILHPSGAKESDSENLDEGHPTPGDL